MKIIGAWPILNSNKNNKVNGQSLRIEWETKQSEKFKANIQNSN